MVEKCGVGGLGGVKERRFFFCCAGGGAVCHSSSRRLPERARGRRDPLSGEKRLLHLRSPPTEGDSEAALFPSVEVNEQQQRRQQQTTSSKPARRRLRERELSRCMLPHGTL